ncbi:B2 bradykinin receptor-like [Dendropsophus ebraccatus]|uniref:B2 bradykinin receptor-like n=1 Tax=Dendropsophus ebraccatus TaxID=150705 RepID=UPI0038313336
MGLLLTQWQHLKEMADIPKKVCLDLGSFTWLRTYHPMYLWFIFILGFTENLFVISVFVLHKSRCTVTEIYLANVAAADLIFFNVACHSGPFGSFMCKAVFSIFQINFYSSIYFLMMVSIERYLALVKSMTIGRLRRPWWAKVNCGIIWVFAVGLSLPDGVFHKVEINEKFNTTNCVTDKTFKNWHIATNIIANVLCFLVPVVITTFCTSQMICVLRNNLMRLCKNVNKERKATWLVLSVFLVFIVCWLPYNINIFIFTLIRFNVYHPCMMKAIDYLYHKNQSLSVLLSVCLSVLYRLSNA